MCVSVKFETKRELPHKPRGKVIDNVATQCFATLGQNDAEVECENGHPCGDPERENPYQGAR